MSTANCLPFSALQMCRAVDMSSRCHEQHILDLFSNNISVSGITTYSRLCYRALHISASGIGDICIPGSVLKSYFCIRKRWYIPGSVLKSYFCIRNWWHIPGSGLKSYFCIRNQWHIPGSVLKSYFCIRNRRHMYTRLCSQIIFLHQETVIYTRLCS